MSRHPTSAFCVDVGSTFTKAALVDLATGEVRGTGATPTTLDTDVLDGVAALSACLEVPGSATTMLCSSAGGGLRLAVVGYERLVTAEAGFRVGLSAGAKVVHVAAGELETFHAGEVVVTEGSLGDALYLVLTGEVEVSKAGHPLARLTAGNFFGEMALAPWPGWGVGVAWHRGFGDGHRGGVDVLVPAAVPRAAAAVAPRSAGRQRAPGRGGEDLVRAAARGQPDGVVGRRAGRLAGRLAGVSRRQLGPARHLR